MKYYDRASCGMSSQVLAVRAHRRNEAYPALRAEGHELCLDLLAFRVVFPLELGAPEELVVLGIAVLRLPSTHAVSVAPNNIDAQRKMATDRTWLVWGFCAL